MKVFVGPCAGLAEETVLGAARAQAGPGGSVVPLKDFGVGNFSRRLSAAEVALLRTALRQAPAGPEETDRIVGYICGGSTPPAPAPPAGVARPGGDHRDAGALASSGVPSTGATVVVVEDHVNLTWRSPLTGPNDDSAGPRFPSMTGIYVPDLVTSCLSTVEGMIVRSGVVAGVLDPEHLNAFEAEAVEAHGYAAVSAELVPVVIVAAHLGLRVAAAVVVACCSCTTEGVA